MMEWQPIETAPKDGTIVLLYERMEIEFDHGKPRDYIFTGFYNKERSSRIYGSHWECAEYDAFNRTPTHWMPLPEAPK